MRFVEEFTLQDLEVVIPWICLRETSVDPKGWHKRCPVHGQSDLVALLVHQFFKGDIVCASLAGVPTLSHLERHYWNRVPGIFRDDPLLEVDLAIRQFGCEGHPPLPPAETCARDQVLTQRNAAARLAKVMALYEGLNNVGSYR